jgi:hypothetical protein
MNNVYHLVLSRNISQCAPIKIFHHFRLVIIVLTNIKARKERLFSFYSISFSTRVKRSINSIKNQRSVVINLHYNTNEHHFARMHITYIEINRRRLLFPSRFFFLVVLCAYIHSMKKTAIITSVNDNKCILIMRSLWLVKTK